MANSLTGNPIYIDTAVGSTMSDIKIQQLQWVDTATSIVDGDDLSFTLDSVTVAIKANVFTAVGDGKVIVYEFGPFGFPVFAGTFVVNVIDNGAVLVWLK
jgi:hypothetical protein